MGRILGIDYGKKRIGLAVTDPLQIFASPLTTVDPEDFYSFLSDYMKSQDIDAFVIGYPVRLNNRPGENVKYIDALIDRLKRTFPGKPVHLMDERFTTRIAQKAIIDGGVRKKHRREKSLVDKISASIILQSFLDKSTFEKNKNKK